MIRRRKTKEPIPMEGYVVRVEPPLKGSQIAENIDLAVERLANEGYISGTPDCVPIDTTALTQRAGMVLPVEKSRRLVSRGLITPEDIKWAKIQPRNGKNLARLCLYTQLTGRIRFLFPGQDNNSPTQNLDLDTTYSSFGFAQPDVNSGLSVISKEDKRFLRLFSLLSGQFSA